MNTFNYNSSEVNYYVSTDYGSIADPVTSTIDNGDTAYDLVVSGDYIVTGDVLVNDFNVEPDYDEINFTETTYPFGTIKIGSEVAPAATVIFVAKPEPLKLYSKAIPVRKRAWIGSGTLFELSNGLERIAAPYIGGSGPLRVSGAAEDSATFKFTEESVKTYGADVDFGLVTGAIGSSVDYGQTTDVVDEGETDHGDIVIGDGLPYGLFTFAGGNTTDVRIKAYQGSGSATISGQASEQFNEPTPQSYIVNSVHNQRRIPSLFRIYNSVNPDAFSRASYIGSGSLFEIGQKDEKAVFVYNVDPILGQTYETIGSSDAGTVDQSAGVNEDYGTVSEGFTNGILDYGQLTPGLFKFGNINITGGDRAHANPKAYRGDGQIKTARGNATVQFDEPALQTYTYGLSKDQTSRGEFLKFGGTAAESTANVPPEPIGTAVTAGSFFSSGEKEERVVFDYNLDSIVYLGDDIDYGSVTTSSSGNEDLGLITQPVTNGEVSYGQVVITSITYPYGGLFKLTGGDRAHANPKAYLGSTAEINITGGAVEKFTSGAGESTILFTTSGGDSDKIVKVFTGEGSLFHVGDRVERTSYSYNTSSIITIEDPTDWGGVTTSSTQSLDFGSVDLTTPTAIDFGDVSAALGKENPFGLFKITGAATEDFFPTFAWNRKSPAIRIFNEQQDPADFRFMPHWRSRHLLGTPTLRNAPDGEFNTYARVRPYIGSGSLFNIGDKLERVVYDYNESSVAEFTVGGDYGFITSSATTNIDYGPVGGIVTEGEFDNGQVVITQIEYPLTGLFEFTGAAESQFLRGPYVAKSGRIRIFNEQQDPADFRFSPHWRSRPYEQGKLTGDAETPRARDFVGSGSLFHIGDKIEKKVYRYSSDSIVEFETGINHGLITDAVTTSLDYGVVGAIVTEGELDNGQIVITDTTRPYGLFRFSGEGVEKKSSIPPAERFEINISGGAVEKVTSGDDENTILFNFTGSLTERFGKGNYDGSGSLFHIGDKVEKATFHYNTSSIIDGSSSEEYGSITDPVSSSVDYGSVGSDYLPPNTDHGLVITVPGDENPLGRLFGITGAAIKKEINSHVGSGSLFAVGGEGDSVAWQTPEETFLLKMRGGAVERHVENWVGTGNIKIKEETPLAPNAAVRFRPWWRSYGEINLRGFGEVEDILINYVSRGGTLKFYTPDEGDEWLRYRPSPRYVNSVYGKIGGSAFVQGVSDTRKINVYGYYGNDRDPGTSGSLFTFNSGTVAAGYNPETDTVLFNAYGSSPSKWNPAWASRPDGSPRLSGTPGLQLRFNIFTNPEGESARISGTTGLKIGLKYDASGSLFALGGSTETRGFNPTTDTVLFRASGTPVVLFSLLHIGSGTFSNFGGAAESRTIDAPTSTVLFVPSGAAEQRSTNAYLGEGSTSLSGNLSESQTDVYVGEGSLFGAGGAAESSAIVKPESTVLFVPSGTASDSRTRSAVAEGNITISDIADEAFARPYIGSGSLFSVGGLSESVGVAEESTGLFTFVGNATIERSRDFVGSGSLFSVGGASEIAAVSPDLEIGLFAISGSADESRTRVIVDNGGSTFVYGNGEEVYSRIYNGEGSLFSVGGATEVFSNAAPENTVLYDIDGRGVVTRTRGFEGSESINVFSEDLIPVVTLSYVGSGDLTTFGGAAESRTITSESTVLFTPSGTANESFTKAIIDNEGSATISGGVSDIKLTRSANVFAYVSTDGQAVEKQTDHYTGSGSLFGLNSATIARAVDYDETSVGAQGEIISTNLFTFNGSNPGSVTRITQPGTVRFKVTGSSVNVLKLFSPIRIFGTII